MDGITSIRIFNTMHANLICIFAYVISLIKNFRRLNSIHLFIKILNLNTLFQKHPK